jgi:replicative DNA helicase
MRRLNDMLVGGLPLGHIVNIAAGTGLGKTSFINEMVYYWIFNSPHKIGIVSMELDAGQYGELILGRHLSRKLALIPDEHKKLEYLTSEKVKNKANELFFTKDGKDRFYLLDNRDGSIEEIQNTIEELVISCGCRIVILDPLQDILDGLTIDEQAVFMKWCKGLIKSHNVTMILINHVRKASSGSGNSAKGDSFTEEEIQGSSTIIKSASVNILLSRNKYAEDEVERNTTRIMLSKNRICGLTGPAGEVYYENETNTLWDKEVYFSTTTETPQDIQSKS